MKRALTAAIFGGLFAIVVPNVALAGTTRPVAPYDHTADHSADHNAEHKEGEAAGQPEEAPEAEQTPQQRHGDREQEHSDGGEILF
jgi:hypothetical protein